MRLEHGLEHAGAVLHDGEDGDAALAVARLHV